MILEADNVQKFPQVENYLFHFFLRKKKIKIEYIEISLNFMHANTVKLAGVPRN